MASRWRIYHHDGGPRDRQPFLVNVDNITKAVQNPDSPDNGSTITFVNSTKKKDTEDITETITQLANDAALPPPSAV